MRTPESGLASGRIQSRIQAGSVLDPTASDLIRPSKRVQSDVPDRPYIGPRRIRLCSDPGHHKLAQGRSSGWDYSLPCASTSRITHPMEGNGS